jgi:hypothetical protein
VNDAEYSSAVPFLGRQFPDDEMLHANDNKILPSNIFQANNLRLYGCLARRLQKSDRRKLWRPAAIEFLTLKPSLSN